MRVCDVKVEDRILLEKAARNGCCESLAAVYLKYQPIICDFLHKSGADDMAEDVCQTVFMQLLEGKCSYDGSSEVKSYLFGVARNIFNNEIKIGKIKTYEISSVEFEGDLLIRQSSPDCPLEALKTAEHHQFLTKAMALVPSKANQAVKMVYFEGIPAKKAAQAAGCDFNTFRKRIELGLRCLCKTLKNLDI